MKVDLIRKFKWYIIGFILIAIMLSVSLSFCAWDTLSIKASLSGNGGNYSTIIDIAEDRDNNGSISIGDIVTYGRFYQEADAIITSKTNPMRWIVVDYDVNKKVATLLTEKIIVYGNSWGELLKSLNQNYYISTVRSWLNSGKGSLKGSDSAWSDTDRYDDNIRNDGVGSTFGINQPHQANKGFLDVAFTETEKNILIPKQISNMEYLSNFGTPLQKCTTIDGRDNINDLVWLPSYYEVYGKNDHWGFPLVDGIPKEQFAYFDDITLYEEQNGIKTYKSNKAISTATPYAMDAKNTGYYNSGNSDYGGDGWWLRSPRPGSPTDMLAVYPQGQGLVMATYLIHCGVRPAVCIQL